MPISALQRVDHLPIMADWYAHGGISPDHQVKVGFCGLFSHKGGGTVQRVAIT
jgi:hypothetical protein